jgi:mxaJ protein
MADDARSRSRAGAAALCAAFAVASAAHAQTPPLEALRVCADPNNLPFSNEAGEGFENRIAELLADELDAELAYTWWAQRRGFIRNTLRAGDCDLVLGVPEGDEMVETTRPYYRSSYVFVHRESLGEPIRSMLDPRLEELDIGVHLTGDDGSNPPPVHALGRLGIVDNVSGYMIYGDYRDPDPTARLIEAVANGDVDVAAAWGPIGAYFANERAQQLVAHSIVDTEIFAGLPFEFSIAMGVRKGETEFRDLVQSVIDRRADDIHGILRAYHVPLMPLQKEPSR